MILLDILEIVISTYLKIRTSRLIANNDSLRMQLQGGNCPHLVHGTLNGLLQRTSLVMTIYHDQYLLSVKNRTYTNRYRSLRNFIHVIIKPENVNILNGNAEDLEAECASYEARMKAVGGVDLFLGGIGPDGHIAFNEPPHRKQ